MRTLWPHHCTQVVRARGPSIRYCLSMQVIVSKQTTKTDHQTERWANPPFLYKCLYCLGNFLKNITYRNNIQKKYGQKQRQRRLLRLFGGRIYSGKFRSLLPLLPCTWNLLWGKKTPPYPVIHLGDCTTHQLTDQLVTWLIDSYQQVGVHDPDRSRT